MDPGFRRDDEEGLGNLFTRTQAGIQTVEDLTDAQHE